MAARLTGALVRRLGQPQVVGEMIAGIALGPSLLGAQAPQVAALLFPAGSLGFLNTLSQIGLVGFMFLVGLELDPKAVRERGRSALLISHASIVAERRLIRTPIGAVAIACAAIDDVTAWCILAAVVIIVRATGGGAADTGLPLWVTLGGSAAFVAFMLTAGKRALRVLETRYVAPRSPASAPKSPSSMARADGSCVHS